MNNDDEMKKIIGAKIRAARQYKKLTQYALAEKVDMDEKQLSRLESGKHYPTLKTLLAIISELGLSLSDFDECKNLKSHEYYTLVEILRNSTTKDIKKYLTIIKTIKE